MYHPNKSSNNNNSKRTRSICVALGFGERHKIYTHTYTRNQNVTIYHSNWCKWIWNAYARVSFPKRNIDNYYVHSSIAYQLSLISIPITAIQIDTHICKMLQSMSLTLGPIGDFGPSTVIVQSLSVSPSLFLYHSYTRAKIPLPWKN